MPAPDQHPHPDDEAQAHVGHDATRPSSIPRQGWRAVLTRTKDEVKQDRVGLMAAGVAFYAMLAIFPTIIAAMTIWAIVADVAQIQQTIDSISAQLPAGAGELIKNQVSDIASSPDATLGWTVAASLAAALWSASSGTKGLMNAVNAAYGEDETRGFVRVRGIALALTIGAIFFGLVALAMVAAVPAVLGVVGLSAPVEALLRWGRWVILAVAVALGLAVVYRYAPDRSRPRWRWLSWGAGVAVVVWLAASAGFAWYVNAFGSFGETYGTLAGVIVLMLWLFLSAFAILLGAELNAAMELQTGRDTTAGAPAPRGRRGAHVADVPPGRA